MEAMKMLMMLSASSDAKGNYLDSEETRTKYE
jgi:hypothetical protein